MSEPVHFYFDFSSPYGYFAAVKIDGLAEGFGRSVVWHPFMLGVIFKKSGNRPLTQQPLKGDYVIKDWERLARFQDLRWQFPETFPVATLAAARAYYWLAETDAARAKKFGLAVYDTYFGLGEDISDAEKIADIAAGLGIDRGELLAAVGDDKWKQRLKDETAAAIDKGVFGSPYFIVDGEGFWGADRLWMVKRWLKSGGW